MKNRFRTCLAAVVIGFCLPASASAQLFAATLPQARATGVGVPVTLFASIANVGTAAATNCRPTLGAANVAPVTLHYQTTNAANALTAQPDTPATIAVGAVQSYVLTVTATAAYSGSVGLAFLCDGHSAPLDTAVNDFNLVAQINSGPDIIPVAVTPSGDGVVRIATIGGAQAMAAAAVNIGVSSTIEVTPEIIGTTAATATATIVETSSAGAPLGQAGSSVWTFFPYNAPRYFAVFVTASPQAGVPFQPDTVRVALRFRDTETQALRGQTSAALIAPGPPVSSPATAPLGIWETTVRETLPDGSTFKASGLAIVPEPTKLIDYQIQRTEGSVAGNEVLWRQNLIPYTVAFTGSPQSGSATGSSTAYLRDTNTTLPAHTAKGLDGATAAAFTFAGNTGLSWAYLGTTASGQPFNGTVQASYSAHNFQDTTLADFAGSWDIYDGETSSPSRSRIGTLSVTPSGAISGTAADGACTFAGQIADPAGEPDILVSTDFAIAGATCPIRVANAEAYAFKMGQALPPSAVLAGFPQGSYYGLLYHGPGAQGTLMYLARAGSAGSPTVTLSSSKASAAAGEAVTLTWSPQGATSCRATGAWSGALVPRFGSRTIGASGSGPVTYGVVCSNGPNSASAQTTIDVTTQTFFQEIPDALNVVMPPRTGASTIVVPLDVNRDGKDDLVVHYWGGYFGQVVGNIPCNDALRIFILQPDGRFTDQTSLYLPGGAVLNGCSRKSRVADLNADGKLDILFGLNQEDGRQQASSDDQSTQMGAMISTGNVYVARSFGAINWYHSAATGVLPNGKAFGTGVGFGPRPTEITTFDSAGNPTVQPSPFPTLSPNTIEFWASTGNIADKSDRLLQTGIYPNLMGLEGYALNAGGVWESTGTIPTPFPQVGTVTFISYTGDQASNVPVHTLGNGVYILGAGSGDAITESCPIALRPGGLRVYAMRMGTPIIANYVPGVTTTVDQRDNANFLAGQKLVGATIANGQTASVPLNIQGEQLYINSNFLSCGDVNADGYQDITVYPYSTHGRPDVYLNTKADGFAYIGASQFPAFPDAWGSAASSLLHDFDKDGLADLLYWPSNGYSGASVAYHFYKGLKPLTP